MVPERFEVCLYGCKLGLLTQKQGRCAFAYDDFWLGGSGFVGHGSSFVSGGLRPPQRTPDFPCRGEEAPASRGGSFFVSSGGGRKLP